MSIIRRYSTVRTVLWHSTVPSFCSPLLQSCQPSSLKLHVRVAYGRGWALQYGINLNLTFFCGYMTFSCTKYIIFAISWPSSGCELRQASSYLRNYWLSSYLLPSGVSATRRSAYWLRRLLRLEFPFVWCFLALSLLCVVSISGPHFETYVVLLKYADVLPLDLSPFRSTSVNLLGCCLFVEVAHSWRPPLYCKHFG